MFVKYPVHKIERKEGQTDNPENIMHPATAKAKKKKKKSYMFGKCNKDQGHTKTLYPEVVRSAILKSKLWNTQAIYNVFKSNFDVFSKAICCGLV